MWIRCNFLIKYHATKKYGESQVQPHEFLASVIDDDVRSAWSPDPFDQKKMICLQTVLVPERVQKEESWSSSPLPKYFMFQPLKSKNNYLHWDILYVPHYSTSIPPWPA